MLLYRFTTSSKNENQGNPRDSFVGFERRLRWREASEEIPGDPSEEESEGDPVAGLCPEVGDDLRDLGDTPADETNQTEPKRDFVVEVTEAVLEVLLHPIHAGLLLVWTVPS